MITKIWCWGIILMRLKNLMWNEPPRDKTNNVALHPVKTQISLGIRPVWSESSLCAQWTAKGPSFLHADSEDSDQTGRMPRLIWVFAGRTLTLLVLSRGDSNCSPWAKYRNKQFKKYTVNVTIKSKERQHNGKRKQELCYFVYKSTFTADRCASLSCSMLLLIKLCVWNDYLPIKYNLYTFLELERWYSQDEV